MLPLGTAGCQATTGVTATARCGAVSTARRGTRTLPAWCCESCGRLLWGARIPVALRETVLIVLDADVFHDLAARLREARGVRHGERPSKRARILERHVTTQRGEICPRPPLHHVQLLGVLDAAA